MKQKQIHRHREQPCGCSGERKRLGVWDQQMQTITYRMDKQDPTVRYREVYSISCDKSYKNMKKNTYAYIHGSLCYTSETNKCYKSTTIKNGNLKYY